MEAENKVSSDSEEQVLEDVGEAPELDTLEKEAVEEPKVPLHEHTALRSRAQAAELEAAELKGRLAAMTEMQTKQTPAAKSPLDLEIERQAAEGIDEDDMVISPALYRKQQIYDKQIANQQAEARAKEEINAKRLSSVNNAKAKYDDWQTVIDAGGSLLTKGEVVDLEDAGVDFGEKTYKKCLAAIERSKPASTTKQKQTPSELEAVRTKLPSQKEILAGIEGIDPLTAAAALL